LAAHGNDQVTATAIHERRRKAIGAELWARSVLGLLLVTSLVRPDRSPPNSQVGVTVIIHGVEARYDPYDDGYQVTAFLSVLNAEGEPISALDPGDLVVREDGVDIPSFELSGSTEGMGMVLALDTSGSMAAAGKMEAVKQAAVTFIEGMGEADQVGLLSFNESPKLEINITGDRVGVRNFVDLLQPIQNASTCLWDAAFDAVEVASSIRQGRRAVVLLTDGIDERITGGSCSIKTLEDVVAFANDPIVRVPLYTIGVGARVNAQDLARLSDLTGGRSLLAPDAGAVGDVFAELGVQLQRGYVLHYLSPAASGEHGLFVQVDYQGATDQETRNFRAAELPGRASFSGLSEQQLVSQDLSFTLEVTSEQEAARVEFYLGEKLIGEDGLPPFEGEWRTGSLEPGPYELRGVAYAEDGSVLAVARVGVRFQAAEAAPPEASMAAEVASDTTGGLAEVGAAEASSLLLVIGLPLLTLAIVGGGLLLVRRSRGRRETVEPAQAMVAEGPTPSVGGVVEAARPIGTQTLATLTIESCQDPDLVGQRFEIWERQVLIGRSPECEVVIPIQPVSRIHAVVKLDDPGRDLSLTMDEIALEPPTPGRLEGPPTFRVFDGDPRLGKASTYGTFVDDARVPPEQGLDLRDGGQIRLGRSIAEGRIPPVILTFRDLREGAGQKAEADLTSNALMLADAERPPDEYATEDFQLDQPEDDEFRTEEFKPADDELRTEEFRADDPESMT